MKKVLFAANLDSFFVKFLIPQLKYFKEQGYIVHVASKNENIEIPFCDKKINIPFPRSLNFRDFIESYKKLNFLIKSENYSLVSCHTPFGGAITRLVTKKYKNLDVYYTAHGFHFFKGAPLKNWILYYPMEKYLSKFTKKIITINKEDYEFAKKKFKTNISYIHGIGAYRDKLDVKLEEKEVNNLRKKLKINKNTFVMIFLAELNDNKNQKLLIDTVNILKDKIKDLCLLLPGNDSTNGELEKYAKNKDLEKYIRFLGYQKDVISLLNVSNITVSSSKREGLPINIIEGMYLGHPIVATNCRGNRDLVKDGVNGFLVYSFKPEEFSDKIFRIYKDKKLQNTFSKENKMEAEKYMVDNVLSDIINEYDI